ncbi:MAG: sulfatase-like hydrolase/transferase [Acidobacteriota bacterium]
MKNLRFLTDVAALLAGLVLVGACAEPPEPNDAVPFSAGAPRPNVVLILADDLGYSDIGSYGGEIRTPHLDLLAAQGLRFSQFYNAGRCCPTRAALLTGRYAHEAGVGRMVSPVGLEITAGAYQGFLAREVPTIAESLRTSGYGTYLSGKWHVGERSEHWPSRRGFDRTFSLISGASSYWEILREGNPMVRQMSRDGEPWEPTEDFYMTDAFTQAAVEQLQHHQRERPDAPFFLYLAYTAPHWPLHAPEEDIARYQGRYDGGWEALRRERWQRLQAMHLFPAEMPQIERPASVPAWKDVEDKDRWSDLMEVYAAMVDRMDQGIGRVLDQLDAMRVAEDTLVIFLSDNGACAESIANRGLDDPSVALGGRGSYVAYRESPGLGPRTRRCASTSSGSTKAAFARR